MRTLKRIGTGLLAMCLSLALAVPALASSGATGAGGDSTIEIVVYEKQPVLTIQVVDKASGAGLSQVRVELRDPDHPAAPPITGSPLGTHETDANGKIEIKLFPDADKKYQIWVAQAGYDPYVGDIFTVQNDTYKLVELVKPVPPGGDDDDDGDNEHCVYYHAGAGGSLDGVDREWVAHNDSPQKIPVPVPDDGYVFRGWMLDGKYVEPETLEILGAIHLYAVFELQPAPAPSPTPAASPLPTPTPANPPSPPPAEHPGGPDASGPQPSGHTRPAASGSIGPGDSPDGPGGSTGGGPGGGPEDGAGGRLPGTNEPAPDSTSPAAGPEASAPGQVPQTGGQVYRHWPILFCTVLTTALGFLRLWAIHRRLKELAQPEEEKELISK